jgi:crossover junction endodeoxyribonuclease RusA
MIYRFTVPGQPVPKARHRSTRDGHMYTAEATTEQEFLVQAIFVGLYGKPEVDPKEYFQMQCWFYTRNRAKMDIDNLCKLVMDSMNGLAFKDDSRVWDLEAHRRVDEDNPRTEVAIMPL